MSKKLIKEIKLVGIAQEIKLTKTTSRVANSTEDKKIFLVVKELIEIIEQYNLDVEDRMLIPLAKFVVKYFSSLFLSDLMAAFDEASSGKYKMEIGNFGRGLTKDLLGKVLRIYSNVVAPGRKVKKTSTPTEARVISREQICHQYAHRFQSMVDQIANGKARTVLVMYYQYLFLRKCGVEWSVESMVESRNNAEKLVRKELESQKLKMEIKRKDYEETLRSLEKRSNMSLDDVSLEQSKLLVLEWLKSTPFQSFEQKKQFFLENYNQEAVCK